MIELRTVSKSFPMGPWPWSSKRPILHDISHAFEPGKVTGIVGANGAGKTTLFRIIAALLKPEQGGAWIDGKLAHEHPGWVRSRVALLGEKPNLPPGMTGRQAILEYGSMMGYSWKETEHRAWSYLEMFQVRDFWNEDTKGYSRGQAMKVALIKTLMTSRPYLILDEPTIGLDFKTAAAVRRLILDEAERGRTVILATHILAELDRLCHHYIGLESSKLISDDIVRGWLKEEKDRTWNHDQPKDQAS